MCKLAFHTWQHVPAKKSLDIQSQQNIGGLRVPGNWFCRLPILWALGKSWRKVDLYLYLYLFFQLSLYLYIFLYLRVYLYLYLAQTLWENLWPRWVCPSLVPDPCVCNKPRPSSYFVYVTKWVWNKTRSVWLEPVHNEHRPPVCGESRGLSSTSDPRLQTFSMEGAGCDYPETIGSNLHQLNVMTQWLQDNCAF